MKIRKIWNLDFHGKYSEKFREIDLFDFTSFLDWSFLNFVAHCAITCDESSVSLNSFVLIFIVSWPLLSLLTKQFTRMIWESTSLTNRTMFPRKFHTSWTVMTMTIKSAIFCCAILTFMTVMICDSHVTMTSVTHSIFWVQMLQINFVKWNICKNSDGRTLISVTLLSLFVTSNLYKKAEKIY